MKVVSSYLSQFPSIRHAFFGPDQFHLRSRQELAMVDMVGHSVPLLTVKQVHGNKVIHVTEATMERKEADGLVTKLQGVALGILTADCGPVLFYDHVASVIGICHAGWRGAQGGILQATLKAMEDLGAKRIHIYAALGPTIIQQNYEVGPEFPELIGGSYDDYFCPSERKGHHYFNLPFYICHQLLQAGLVNVHDIGLDTFSGNFASRRRFLTQGQESGSLHNLSAIAIV